MSRGCTMIPICLQGNHVWSMRKLEVLRLFRPAEWCWALHSCSFSRKWPLGNSTVILTKHSTEISLWCSTTVMLFHNVCQTAESAGKTIDQYLLAPVVLLQIVLWCFIAGKLFNQFVKIQSIKNCSLILNGLFCIFTGITEQAYGIALLSCSEPASVSSHSLVKFRMLVNIVWQTKRLFGSCRCSKRDEPFD